MSLFVAGTEWQSSGEGFSAEFTVYFRYEFNVRLIRIMQIFCGCNSLKDVQLAFSDGTTVDVSTCSLLESIAKDLQEKDFRTTIVNVTSDTNELPYRKLPNTAVSACE